jgi:hypothetical protein
VRIGEEDVGRFYIAVNEAFRLRGLQAFRDLNSGLEHLRFRHSRRLRHEVVEAAVIDQFHHEVDLPVIGPGGVNLDDVRMIHGRGDARLLLEPRGFGRIGAQFLPQKFQRDKAIEARVARLVNRSPSRRRRASRQRRNYRTRARPETSRHSRAGDVHQRLEIGDVDDGAARGAALLRHVGNVGHQVECSIGCSGRKDEQDATGSVGA